MRKYKRALVSFMLGVLASAALAVPTASVWAQGKATTQDIATRVKNMSTRDKITQMLMPDFRNWKVDGQEKGVTSLNDDIKTALKKYKFGGVILFAENVVETEQTARLTHDFQATVINNGDIPLLLTIDQEGGIVRRLGTGTSLPGNMALGATKSTEDAYKAGAVTGDELASLGINTNFAPSIDVNNNPNNPVIGLRSFSSDPQLVSELGTSFIQGIQDKGVVSAAKHFPGHGDTDTDSHVGLPVVDKSLDELNKTELVPFRAAADAGVDMFMTAHIQYPQIETETFPSKVDGSKILLPATMSPKILTDLVRKDMGYKGVIVTDALGMQAIADNFGESDACIQAIKAGADILLMPTTVRSNEDLKKIDTIIADIEKAVKDGKISEKRLDESVTRILELKEKRGILALSDGLPSADEQVAEAKQHVGSAENRATERQLSLDAMTVLKNKNNVLPVKPKKGEKVLFITSASNQVPGTEFSIARMQKEGTLAKNFAVETTSFTSTSKASDFDQKVDQADYVVVYTNMASAANLKEGNYGHDVPQGIFDYAKAKQKKTIQVSTNKPYDGANFDHVDASILTYGYLGMDPTEGGAEPKATFGPNIPAAVELLFGRTAPKGTLPVDLPKIENGVMSTSQFDYQVGDASSDWLNLKKLQVKAEKEKVEPGSKVRISLSLPESSLDSKQAKITLKLGNKAFKFADSDRNEKTISYKENKKIVLKIDKKAQDQTVSGLFSSASLTDRYSREFKVEEISDPALEIAAAEKTDKTRLHREITKANKLKQKNYTPESWTQYKTALLQAKKVNKDQMANQEQIDQAEKTLKKARRNLVKRANKKSLQKEIDRKDQLDQKNYTPASWSKYEDEWKQAKKINQDKNASQKQVDHEERALRSARHQLKKK